MLFTAVELMPTYFDLFHEDPESRHSATQDRVFFPKVSTQKLLWYWLRCESKPSRAGGLLDKIQLLFRFGMAGRSLFGTSFEERIPLLQNAYYLRKREELESSKAGLEHSLAGFCFYS
jgi:hypothetical protein